MADDPISAVGGAIARVAAIIPDLLDDKLAGDVAAIATLLRMWREFHSDLRIIESEIEQALVPLIPYGGTPVEGVGYVEVRGGKARSRYDQPMIVSAFAERMARVIAEEKFGYASADELPETLRDALNFAATEMAAATGALAPSFTSWRSGVAKKYGINLAIYAGEISPSPKSIIIREST